MREAAALFALGALGPIAQGALSRFLPAGWCPDLGFLTVLAVGLCWRNAVGGLMLAAAIGFVCDLLSGSLLGQHALLFMVAYGAARYVSLHFNLRGAGARVALAVLLTVLHGLSVAGVTAFFSRGSGLFEVELLDLLRLAVANGLAALLVVGLVASLISRLADDEGGRRVLRLEPRKFSA